MGEARQGFVEGVLPRLGMEGAGVGDHSVQVEECRPQGSPRSLGRRPQPRWLRRPARRVARGRLWPLVGPRYRGQGPLSQGAATGALRGAAWLDNGSARRRHWHGGAG